MSRRLAVLWAVLACSLLAVAPACAAPASTAAPPLFGFNDNAYAWGQLTAGADATLAQGAGATTSRIVFDWRWAQPSPSQLNLAKYDAIYAADLAAGIKPLFHILFAPQWTWDAGVACLQADADCRYPPSEAKMSAIGDIAKLLVRRYPQMAGLEVWNEPNLRQYWQSGVDPARYALMVRTVYDAVRSTGSSVPVVAGALANGADADSADKMSIRGFLNGMYAAGVKGKMDAISIHPYPAGDIDLWRFYQSLTETREVRDAHGDAATPLWITETGVSTTATGGNWSFDPNDQGVMLVKLIQELRAMPDVRAIVVHTLVNPSIFPVTSSERGFGVTQVDGAPKVAYCEIARLNATSYECPADVAPATSDPVQDRRWAAQVLVQKAADAARTYRASHGSYTGLTAAELNAIEPAISPKGISADVYPGATADPAQVGVWVTGTGADQTLLLCNASQADRSYCVWTKYGQFWTYGKAEGSVYTAAGAVTKKASWWW